MVEIFTRVDYENNGPPPRTKSLVAYCLWGWGPGSCRGEAYFISGNRSGREWKLWCKPGDSDLGVVWFNPAFIRLEKRVLKYEAAQILLREAWAAEWRAFRSPGSGVEVIQKGILSDIEVQMISKDVFVD